MNPDRNFKKVEHRKHCRMCWAVAQLKRGKRTYCARCYHMLFQMPLAEQDLGEPTPADVMHTLAVNTFTGRTAAELLARLPKERTV